MVGISHFCTCWEFTLLIVQYHGIDNDGMIHQPALTTCEFYKRFLVFVFPDGVGGVHHQAAVHGIETE